MRAALELVPRVHKLRGVWLFPREGGDGCVTDVTKVSQAGTILILLLSRCGTQARGTARVRWCLFVPMRG